MGRGEEEIVDLVVDAAAAAAAAAAATRVSPAPARRAGDDVGEF